MTIARPAPRFPSTPPGTGAALAALLVLALLALASPPAPPEPAASAPRTVEDWRGNSASIRVRAAP